MCVCEGGGAGGGCVLGTRRCRSSQDCQVKTSGAITTAPPPVSFSPGMKKGLNKLRTFEV